MVDKYHKPVLLNEVAKGLQVRKGGKYIDATLGDGGHTIKILESGGEVLGIDFDKGSLKRAKSRIKDRGLEDAFTGVYGNFRNIDNLAKKNGFEKVDGILFDLGYSSSQILDSKIGLSFKKDQPLDMRMDKSLSVTGADLINALPESGLKKLFKIYGEERYASKFANALVEARKLKKIATTKDLVNIIVGVAPLGYEKGRLHPATRVFQALRIAVNDEIESLKTTLPKAARLLLPGGRMAVISFHSLEDRVVKRLGSDVLLVLKGYIVPSKQEVKSNPRSRSAKMRVFERA